MPVMYTEIVKDTGHIGENARCHITCYYVACIRMNHYKNYFLTGYFPHFMYVVSLIAADNKLIVLHEKGTLYIVEASLTSYKEISSFKILDHKGIERWWAA